MLKSVAAVCKCLQEGHNVTSNYQSHTLGQCDITGAALSPAHSSTVGSTGKWQPMKLIGWCVFYEKNSLCCLDSLPLLSDWLPPKWPAFPLAAVIGGTERHSVPASHSPLPSFPEDLPLLFAKLSELSRARSPCTLPLRPHSRWTLFALEFRPHFAAMSIPGAAALPWKTAALGAGFDRESSGFQVSA